MNFRSKCLSAVVVLAAATCAGSASATEMIATITGTVSDSNVTDGSFGGSGSSLNGASFTAVYYFNPEAATSRTTDPATAFDIASGGLADSPSSVGPLYFASLTINGEMTSFNPTYSSNAEVAGGALSYLAVNAPDGLFGDVLVFQTNMTGLVVPGNLDSTLDEDVTANGGFGFEHDQFSPNGPGVISAHAELDASHISVVLFPNPVPEPATWALMIGGFGLAGTALRRRARLAA